MPENRKFYSQNAIAFASYLGGPLAAGLLVRRNALNLGKKKQALYSLIIGIISTILLLALVFQMPEDIIEKIPKPVIPAIYTGIIALVVELMHGEILKKHKKEGGAFYSFWRAAGIGFVGLAVFLGCAVVYGYYEVADWDVQSHDSGLKRFEKCEEEAMKLYALSDNVQNKEVMAFIEQTGIPKWKEGLDILNRINAIENIPEEFQKQNNLLIEYTRLRIEAFELMLKAIMYETTEYDETIYKKHARIDEIVGQL